MTASFTGLMDAASNKLNALKQMNENPPSDNPLARMAGQQEMKHMGEKLAR